MAAHANPGPDLPLADLVAKLTLNPARILGLPGGSIETGAAADEYDRPPTGPLEVRQQEDLQQVAHVQRGGAGIEADIGADRPCGEALLETVRLKVHEPAPAELVEEGAELRRVVHLRRPIPIHVAAAIRALEGWDADDSA